MGNRERTEVRCTPISRSTAQLNPGLRHPGIKLVAVKVEKDRDMMTLSQVVTGTSLGGESEHHGIRARHLLAAGFSGSVTRSLALSGIPLWYAREVLAEQEQQGAQAEKAKKAGPNDQIVMAAIGVGGQGTGIMKAAKGKPGVKFVAVCDIDAGHAKKAADEVGKDCHEYHDFRELLGREDLNAVTIGTVDHWHALTSIAAMKAGCDVYCEKPLSLTIEEGKAMVQAARKYDRVFQTGSQQRSDDRYRLACELVRNGRVGKVHTVEARIGDNPIGGPFKTSPVPEGLDWDFWKGPTADVPYVKERCHYEFRWWYEYSGGKLTDWGAITTTSPSGAWAKTERAR